MSFWNKIDCFLGLHLMVWRSSKRIKYIPFDAKCQYCGLTKQEID